MRQDPPERAFGQRGTLARLFAACVGVLCLVAQFSSTLHLLLVDHVHCAQHGEWVHVDGEHGHHAAQPVEAVGAEAPSQAVTSVADERGHEHDHCLMGADRRKLAMLPISQPEVRAPDAADKVVVARRSSSTPATHVYSFAPKTSPPALAV
jgi:hypothetical protein